MRTRRESLERMLNIHLGGRQMDFLHPDLTGSRSPKRNERFRWNSTKKRLVPVRIPKKEAQHGSLCEVRDGRRLKSRQVLEPELRRSILAVERSQVGPELGASKGFSFAKERPSDRPHPDLIWKVKSHGSWSAIVLKVSWLLNLHFATSTGQYCL